MSSAGKKRENDHSFFVSERPRFFKIILEDTIRKGKLVMPRKFVKHYGSSLPSKVFLRVPSGAVWQVELSEENDNILLNNGWREFVDNYSIGYGHLLIFEHKGCGRFNVFIFDKSATEILYPTYGTTYDEEPQFDGKYEDPEIEGTLDDDSVEILPDFATSQRARERPLSRSSLPRKKMRNDSTSQANRTLMSIVPRYRQKGKRSSVSNPGTSCLSGKEFQGGGSMSSGWKRSKARVFKEPHQLTLWKNSKSSWTASAFQSENPYVTIFMHPRYLTKSTLGIPVNFARELFTERDGNVTLCVSDGRSWSVKYHWYGQLSKPKASFMQGWTRFVVDNNLKVGDACVFELIKSRLIKLKVTIFRIAEDPNVHQSLGNAPTLTGKVKDEAVRRAIGFKSNRPYFTIIMKKSYICPAQKLCIPSNFVKRHLNEKQCRIILRGQDGRTWPVKLHLSYGHAFLLCGWRTFSQENNLQVGDICVFELIGGIEILFNVFISTGYQPACQDPINLLC